MAQITSHSTHKAKLSRKQSIVSKILGVLPYLGGADAKRRGGVARLRVKLYDREHVRPIQMPWGTKKHDQELSQAGESTHQAIPDVKKISSSSAAGADWREQPGCSMPRIGDNLAVGAARAAVKNRFQDLQDQLCGL